MTTGTIILLGLAMTGCSAEVSVPFSDASYGDANIDKPDSGSEPVPELRGDGAPCNFDAQCVNNTCIPSKNSFGTGVCFSAASNGCVAVTEPSPFKKLCEMKRLFTCGDAYDIAKLGLDCEIVGVGDLFEYYHCCPEH